ncbi:MAG: histidinol dehydrogenase [Spirochaetia bacterium]|nr:histidinol dehydrogenase [Spirochaetia bacterium]
MALLLQYTGTGRAKVHALIDKMNWFELETADTIKSVINDVEKNGDRAVNAYTLKFDGVKVDKLRVPAAVIKKAYGRVDKSVFKPMEMAVKNIRAYHLLQMKNIKGFVFRNKGYTITHKYLPVDSAGIYIPGGQSPLFSTLLMAAIPAVTAGVKRVALVSPPRYNGDVGPYVLVAADMIGIKEIYRVGGAQAIAALACGTQSIPRVDKIAGPGNIYSTMAKKHLFGKVGIDSLNGPSEVTVIADGRADSDFITYDLLAQAEHVNGHSLLLTDSMALAKSVMQKLGNVSYDITIVVTKNLKEAAALAQRKAPEHLTLAVRKPEQLQKLITNAPAIFAGDYTPVAFGDYMAGSNHILPTNGTARFFSGLSVLDFLKHTHVVKATKDAMERFGPAAEALASIETLKNHAKSIAVRREK